MWLASFFAFSRTARDASSTELPAVTICRLAKAPSPSAAPEVSPDTTVMSSERSPSSLAGSAPARCAALAEMGGAGEDGDLAGVRDPHHARFERAAAGALDAVRDADADIAALLARRACRAGNRPSRRLQHRRLGGRIVAAVVLHAAPERAFSGLV